MLIQMEPAFWALLHVDRWAGTAKVADGFRKASTLHFIISLSLSLSARLLSESNFIQVSKQN